MTSIDLCAICHLPCSGESTLKDACGRRFHRECYRLAVTRNKANQEKVSLQVVDTKRMHERRWRVGDHVICSDSRCEAKFRITNEATASAEKLQCPRCGSSLCLFRRDRLPLLAVDPHAEQDAAMQQDSKNRSKTNGTVNGWTIQSLGKSELVCDGPDAEIIRSVANSDQRTAFLLLIPSKSLSEREGLLISGATACHECGRNILYKLKTGWSGLFDQVHSDGFSCTQCKVEIRVHGLRVRHRGAQVLLLYSEPFTQHQSRQPNAVRISVTQIDLLGAQNAFF